MCSQRIKLLLVRQWGKRSIKNPVRVETWCPNCGNEYYTNVRGGYKCLSCGTVYKEN